MKQAFVVLRDLVLALALVMLLPFVVMALGLPLVLLVRLLLELAQR
jgi:hypothetical protein